MSENKTGYGFTDWNDNSGPQTSNREELPRFEYMRLKDGNNNLRIVTPPAAYHMIKFKGPGDHGFGKRVNTAWPLHEDCPAKTAGFKPKKRYLVGVIDREDNKVKILDMSVLVKEGVQALKDDIEWGDPTTYDVNVRKNSKSKAPAGFYTVLPRSKVPLSQEDLALLDEHKEALEKVITLRTTPSKPEFVLKRMMELGWDGKSGPVVESEDAAELAGSDDQSYKFNRPQAQA